MNSVKVSGKPDPLQFNIEEYVQKSDVLTDKIKNQGPVVLYYSASLQLH